MRFAPRTQQTGCPLGATTSAPLPWGQQKSAAWVKKSPDVTRQGSGALRIGLVYRDAAAR